MKKILSIFFISITLLTSSGKLSANEGGLVPILRFAAGFLNQGFFPQSDLYTTDDEIVIESNDGVELQANIFVPTEIDGLMPAVIFINSWAFNEYQYLNEAATLAEKGYIVLSYTTRGFGKSGGVIDTAGPNDIVDFSNVIDFLLANYPVDPQAIGSAGISYGSGISLIGAAQDGRIKAVSAMSSWGSLEQALYGNQSPRLAWASILVLLSEITGNPDPIIKEHWSVLKHQKTHQVPAVLEWAYGRSPLNHVEKLNEHGTAVYFGKSYGDDLFQPNSLLELFSQLEVPKHIDLVQGTHAASEILSSLFGIGDDIIWANTFKWFDIHLKGEVNDLSYAKPVNMKIKFKKQYDSFSEFPITETQDTNFYLHPRNIFDGSGDLKKTPYKHWFSQKNTINSWAGTFMFSTRIPVLSQLQEQLGVPVRASIPLASKVRSIYFDSGKLQETMKIRGNPSLSLQVKPNYKTMQLVAYLYDMDQFGIGTLITHGVTTLPNTKKNKKVTLDFDMVTTAYDIPKGHRLVVAFDTTDPQYKAPTNTPYSINFEFNRRKQSVLSIPAL